ncbi:MAG: polysaccharide pyruvyl transferase family protein [Lachnospiraceae bacterium]|nr:polysaccharide pyruvyl transferase family protein [Lachnospiraceae bacterium]
MRKVGIITFHHARHSYGAALQAYATVRVLENMGLEAELINYENKYEQTELKIKHQNIIEKIYLVINWIVRMFLFKGCKDPVRKKKNLDAFYKYVSKKKYNTIEELKNTDYEILLAGSDQIWNPEVTGGIDRGFLLDFGTPKKRVSYASSVGSHVFSSEELNTYKRMLERFNSISVREKYAANLLQSSCKTNIKVVCDPTLLLTGDQWRKEFEKEMSSFNASTPYILTYFVGGNIELYWDRIEKYITQLNLPIYNIQSHSKKYKHVNKAIYNIMPEKLVTYISNARVILTDSFHGTAFSINLNRNFVAVINKTNPVRVQSLLESVGLQEREDARLHEYSDIEYSNVNKKLNEIRNDSMEWLVNALR